MKAKVLILTILVVSMFSLITMASEKEIYHLNLPGSLNPLTGENFFSGDDFQIVGFTNLPLQETGVEIASTNQVYYVQPGDSLYKISRKYNTTVTAIKTLNNLKSNFIYVGQQLLVPSAEEPDQEKTEVIYFVQPGDSLYLIARRFGTTVGEIVARNNLDSYYIHVGKMLFINATSENLPTLPGMEVVYYVKPGDTLYKIALKYNTTIDKIMARNDLLTHMLYVDQKLYIPLAETSIPQQPNFVVPYTVEYGDNLVRVARTFEMSPRDLILFNELESDNIYPGQVLQIPFSVPQNELGEGYSTTPEQEKWLARVTYGESRGEPFKGEVAVAAVVINRVKHPFFPNTIESVIFQPWQFSPVQDGQIWLEPEEHAYTAAKAALKGWDPSLGAIYFYNPGKSTSSWIFYRNVIVKIGDHYFAV